MDFNSFQRGYAKTLLYASRSWVYNCDSGCFYDTCQRSVFHNDDSWLFIYQPNKSMIEYDDLLTSIFIKHKSKKLSDKDLKTLKPYMQAVENLYLKSFNEFLETSDGAWTHNVNSFDKLLQIKEPIRVRDDGSLSFKFHIRGAMDGCCGDRWTPHWLELYLDEPDEATDIDKVHRDNWEDLQFRLKREGEPIELHSVPAKLDLLAALQKKAKKQCVTKIIDEATAKAVDAEAEKDIQAQESVQVASEMQLDTVKEMADTAASEPKKRASKAPKPAKEAKKPKSPPEDGEIVAEPKPVDAAPVPAAPVEVVKPEAEEQQQPISAGKTAGAKRARKVKTIGDVRNTILEWSEAKILAEPLAAEFVAAIDTYTASTDEPKRKRAKKA